MIEAGRTVLVSASASPTAKTQYSAQIAVVEDAEGVVYVGVQPLLNQKLAGRILDHVAPTVHTWDSEVVVTEDGGTRLDYVGYTDAARKRKVFVEVKNAMISREVHVARAERRAIFPDGYRKKLDDPISPRAIKHAHTLATLCAHPDTEAAILLFLVSRSDCRGGLVLNPEDPAYCDAIRHAVRAGVRIHAFAVDFSSSGAVTFVGELPVYIDL